jgi:hypothetical protein
MSHLAARLSPRIWTRRHQASCRSCKAEYNRAWYQRNKERHKGVTAAARKKTRAANRALVNEAKSRPCADCGHRYPPCVMDFDHVRGTKVGNIARMKQNMVPYAVLEEIEKCDVVCANCRRLRSFNRQREQVRRREQEGQPSPVRRDDDEQLPLF